MNHSKTRKESKPITKTHSSILTDLNYEIIPNQLIYGPILHGEKTRVDSSTLAAFPWFEDTDNYNSYYN